MSHSRFLASLTPTWKDKVSSANTWESLHSLVQCNINKWETFYFGISISLFWERTAVGCWHSWAGQWLSAALHQGRVWDQGGGKHRKEGHQLPPPRTPFVSSGRQCQPIKNKTTQHLSSFYRRAARITNPLTHSLHAATTSGLLFFII